MLDEPIVELVVVLVDHLLLLNLNFSACLEAVRSSSLSSVPTRVYIVLSKVVLAVVLLERSLDGLNSSILLLSIGCIVGLADD